MSQIILGGLYGGGTFMEAGTTVCSRSILKSKQSPGEETLSSGRLTLYDIGVNWSETSAHAKLCTSVLHSHV